MPTSEQLASLNKIIEDFVVSKISVAKSKLYLPVNLGGLGLIRLDKLLKAQQVTWFKRILPRQLASQSKKFMSWQLPSRKLRRDPQQ